MPPGSEIRPQITPNSSDRSSEHPSLYEMIKEQPASKVPFVEVKHVGLTEDQLNNPDTAILIWSVANSEYLKLGKPMDHNKEAEVEPEKLQKLQKAEQAAKDYMKDKLTRLGAPTEQIDKISVKYTKPHKETKGLGGVFEPVTREIKVVMYDRFDPLGIAQSAAHEVSHASTRNTKIVYNWTPSYNKYPHLKDMEEATGIERIENGKKQGRAIENGLAVLDEMDIYKRYFRDIFSYDWQEREKIINGRYGRKTAEKYTNSVFAPVDVHDLSHFTFPLQAKFLFKNFSIPVIDKTLIPTMRFAQELCKVLGKSVMDKKVSQDVYDELSQFGNLNPQPVSEQQDQRYLMNIGRILLDRDRFIEGKRTGVDTISTIFGEEQAKVLFAADDLGNGVEDAMRVVRAKQKQLGMAA